LSWIAGSEGFSRRGSGKGFVLLRGAAVKMIVQISINYLEYKSAYLGVANSSQREVSFCNSLPAEGRKEWERQRSHQAGPRQKLFII
jgi:hypothetical protein